MKRCKLHSHAPFLLIVSLNILTCLCFPWHQMGPVGLFKEVGELCISKLASFVSSSIFRSLLQLWSEGSRRRTKSFCSISEKQKTALTRCNGTAHILRKTFLKIASSSLVWKLHQRKAKYIYNHYLTFGNRWKFLLFSKKNSLQFNFSVLILNCVYPQASVWLNAAKS